MAAKIFGQWDKATYRELFEEYRITIIPYADSIVCLLSHVLTLG